ncbi:hypothetical protein P7A58_15500, partial [Clostridium perfringens]|nr:hypothetical protein [Clostridium perfringens]
VQTVRRCLRVETGECKSDPITSWDSINDVELSLSAPVSLLQSAISGFGRGEFLFQDEGGAECGECKTRNSSERKMSIPQPPTLLLLSIKRFVQKG